MCVFSQNIYFIIIYKIVVKMCVFSQNIYFIIIYKIYKTNL